MSVSVLVENATNNGDNNCATMLHLQHQPAATAAKAARKVVEMKAYTTINYKQLKIQQARSRLSESASNNISRDVGRNVFTLAITAKNASPQKLANNHN